MRGGRESTVIDVDVRILDRGDVPTPLPNGGTIVYPARAVFGPRVQQDYQLVLVHTGSVHVSVDGVVREIPPGHVGLLRPGGRESFVFARDRETHHGWIALPPHNLDEKARAALDAAPWCLPISEAMQACMDLACSTMSIDDPDGRPVLTAIARAALALYAAEATHVPGATPTEHPAVTHARALARKSACEGLNVQDLARSAHISPEHLVRLFRRDLGTTPGALLRAERRAHGMHLLTHTGLSVAEIAHQSGFASPHHFAQALRAAIGMSPTELRAHGWAARLPESAEADHS